LKLLEATVKRGGIGLAGEEEGRTIGLLVASGWSVVFVEVVVAAIHVCLNFLLGGFVLFGVFFDLDLVLMQFLSDPGQLFRDAGQGRLGEERVLQSLGGGETLGRVEGQKPRQQVETECASSNSVLET
jgi:hypothetical protein